MTCTVVRSSAWSGVVQVPAVIFGRYSSLHVGGRLVAGAGGESQPDKSTTRTTGGVVLVRSGGFSTSTITGSFMGGGGLLSRRGGVSGSGTSVRTACGVLSVLVRTAGGGVEGAGGLASSCGVTGDVSSHGEFLLFCRE